MSRLPFARVLLILAITLAAPLASAQPADESLRTGGVASDAVNWSAGVVYEYDGSGNVKKIGTDSYVYDSANRLLRGSVSDSVQSYSYDAFGNRIGCTQNGGDCQYGWSIDSSTNRVLNRQYDPRGNMVVLPEGNVLDYDALGMVYREHFTGGHPDYIYTADDERIALYYEPSSGGGTWTWTVRGLDKTVLREFTSDDTANIGTGNFRWSKDYVWRDEMLLATRQPDPFAPGTVATYHYHLDHLGTPRQVTDTSGAVIGRHDYLPFGPEINGNPSEPATTRTKFTGHERDTFPGRPPLDYMHARYHEGRLGRFLSVDPHLDVERAMREPQQWNRYSYVVNNPLKYVDPDGEDKLAAWLLGPSYADVSTWDAIFSRGTITDINRGRQEFIADHDQLTHGLSPFPTTRTGVALSMAGPFFRLGGGAITKMGDGLVGFGFKSFDAFKNVVGRAGQNQQWHHIVGQTTSNIGRFGERAIHNSVNLIKVTNEQHALINKIYSSKPAYAGGATVREWLGKKSYKEQWEFGTQVLRDVGVIK